jgi:hypothetical protein
MTSRKTIYISEKDMATWERAEELAGTSLSALLAELLRDYVTAMEGRQPRVRELVKRFVRDGLTPADLKMLRKDPTAAEAMRLVIDGYAKAATEWEEIVSKRPRTARSRRKR